MAVYNDLQLKQWFETGDFPTQQQFFDLIDSKVNVLDLAASTSPQVGVTNIIGGTDRSIVFQQGTKFSESPNFLYDYTNKRIGMDIANPLTRFHVFSSTGNADSAPLVFTFQRSAGAINTNTAWFGLNARNGADQAIAGFSCIQQAAGQGTRFSWSTTTDSDTIVATESMRLSQEKRLSIGTILNNGATLDIHTGGSLSTDLGIRIRNNADTIDFFKIGGDSSFAFKNSVGGVYFQSKNDSTFALGDGAVIANAGFSDVLIGASSYYDNATGTGRIVIGYAAHGTSFYGIAIGQTAMFSNDGGLAIGFAAQASGQGSQSWGMNMRSSATSSIMMGSNYSFHQTNNIANSFMIQLGLAGSAGNFQDFFISGKSNVVLRNNTALTAGTHYETAATNTHTIHNGTNPTGVIADAIQISAKDSSDGTPKSTLSFFLEQTVVADILPTSTHKIKVWINGVEYYIYLETV